MGSPLKNFPRRNRQGVGPFGASNIQVQGEEKERWEKRWVWKTGPKKILKGGVGYDSKTQTPRAKSRENRGSE